MSVFDNTIIFVSPNMLDDLYEFVVNLSIVVFSYESILYKIIIETITNTNMVHHVTYVYVIFARSAKPLFLHNRTLRYLHNI